MIPTEADQVLNQGILELLLVGKCTSETKDTNTNIATHPCQLGQCAWGFRSAGTQQAAVQNEGNWCIGQRTGGHASKTESPPTYCCSFPGSLCRMCPERRFADPSRGNHCASHPRMLVAYIWIRWATTNWQKSWYTDKNLVTWSSVVMRAFSKTNSSRTKDHKQKPLPDRI